MRLRVVQQCALALLAFALVSGTAHAQSPTVRNVPADYPTIQAAIDAAVNGDTVRVAPGTYVENINFKGKAITVESSGGAVATIIDGNQNGSVVTFNTGEGPNSILRGFTIRNGFATFSDPSLGNGGGIGIQFSSPVVEQNLIIQNLGCEGAGISVLTGSALIRQNTISNNARAGCVGGGGGIGIRVAYAGGHQTQIIDNVIRENTGAHDGGGLSLFGAGAVVVRGNTISNNSAEFGGAVSVANDASGALVVNNLVFGNSALQAGGGIYVFSPIAMLNNTIADNNAPVGSAVALQSPDSAIHLTNNLIIGTGSQAAFHCMFSGPSGQPFLLSNNVFSPNGPAYGGLCQDQTGVNGNISVDPLFVEPVSGNYHLQYGSASIDAGDNSDPSIPSTDLDGSTRFWDGNSDGNSVVDMGAFEFQPGLLPPELAGVSPSTGPQGQSVTVTLTGANFVPGAAVLVNSSDISITNVTVVDPLTITATVDLTNAALGGRLIFVRTAAGTSTFQLFIVLGQPVVSGIIPASGVRGTTVNVALSGSNFYSDSSLSVTGAGVTVAGLAGSTGTQLTASLIIAPDAAAGTRSVSVTTLAGTSNAVPFTVNPVTGTPTLTSISPVVANPGKTTTVALTGTNFAVPASVAVVSGTGATVSNVNVVSTTRITVDLIIAANASLGEHMVRVTTPSGVSNQTDFDVFPTAVINTVSPASGNAGAIVNVTLSGANFWSGSTIQVAGGGVTVSNVIRVSTSTMTARFTIASGASAGPRSVTISHGAGISNAVSFDVAATIPPTLTSVSPPVGTQGQAVNVTLTGTNFSAVNGIAVSGTGVSVSNLSVVNTTQISATFTIAGSAATVARNVTVNTAAGTSNTQPFTVQVGAPTLTTVSPATGPRGQSVSVTLTGTNFVGGVSVSCGDVSVFDLNVVSPTQITATFFVPVVAIAGPRTVTVHTATGNSNTQTFTVIEPPPALVSIAPTSGMQGQTVAVTLTGPEIQLSPTVNVSGAGISVSNVIPNIARADQIFATFTIAGNATPGARNVTVTTPAGTSNAMTFTVNALPVPVLNSVSPTAGVAGNAIPVTLNGSNFDGSSVVNISGAGVTVSNTTLVNATQMTAIFTIAPGAATGGRNVTVTTTFGTTSARPFSVVLGPPTLGSILPASGGQGQSFSLTLNGTNFDGSSVVSISGTGVTVSNTVVVNTSQITATFSIAANASIGARNVTVSTAAGASNAQAFTILLGPPTLSSVAPASGTQGQIVNVTLNGSNFDGSSVIQVSGTGVTVSNIIVNSATQINATFTLQGNAATGARNVTVSTSAGTTAARPFTVNAVPAPTFSSISPFILNPGKTYTVTLTGTNFVAPASVAVVSGTGATVSNTVLVNATTITTDFTIAANASIGEHMVRITTPGGVSNQRDFDVFPTAVLNTVTPASGAPGAVVNVTLSGANFWSGSVIQVAGGSITVSNVVRVSTSTMTARFTIAAGATPGPRSVTISHGAGVSNAVTFNVP